MERWMNRLEKIRNEIISLAKEKDLHLIPLKWAFERLSEEKLFDGSWEDFVKFSRYIPDGRRIVGIEKHPLYYRKPELGWSFCISSDLIKGGSHGER